MSKQTSVKKSFPEYVRGVEKAICKYAYKLSTASSMDFDDAKQEMLIAVWKSYTKYDPDRFQQQKFSTYAISRMINRTKTLLNRHIKESQRSQTVEPSVLEECLLDESSATEENRILNKIVLDQMEQVLKQKRFCSKADLRAFQMFLLMRYRGFSLLKCSNELAINQGWLSRVFKEKIRILSNSYPV